MTRVIIVYGVIAGFIASLGLAVTMMFSLHSVVIGYLSMLIALSFVFVGVKRYRDVFRGGVIRFPHALLVGFAISIVAVGFYGLAWEVYLFFTDYQFMPNFISSAVEAKRAEGASEADLAALRASFQDYASAYEKPVSRFFMTISEIAPVALIMTLISAALLRNSRFMPAK
jgi:Protein of unknown function (DUF4199)